MRQNLAEARNEIERTLTECQMSIKLLFPNVYAPDDSTNEPSTAAESGDQIEKLHGYKADDKLTIVIDTGGVRGRKRNFPIRLQRVFAWKRRRTIPT